jgi:hypothetical protein
MFIKYVEEKSVFKFYYAVPSLVGQWEEKFK